MTHTLAQKIENLLDELDTVGISEESFMVLLRAMVAKELEFEAEVTGTDDEEETEEERKNRELYVGSGLAGSNA